MNITVRSLLEELFLEIWNITTNYHEYYHRCAPKICTYSYMTKADFAYMITQLISLCGGLTMILRYIVSLIVEKVMGKPVANDADRPVASPSRPMSVIDELRQRVDSIKKFLADLNLFKSTDRSPKAIRYQKYSTRVFLILWIGNK